jgi:hypothetical protein
MNTKKNNLDILNMKEPILVDNLLTINDNLNILNYLVNNQTFYIQEESNGLRFRHALDNNFSHAGFCSEILKRGDKFNPNSNILNLYTFIICNKLTEILKFNYRSILRVHWNYYLTGQEGRGHVDQEEDNFISILYNPHTTDGGTEILNKTYMDKLGQAKIFKSNWLHRGIATKKDKSRVSLNIVLEL